MADTPGIYLGFTGKVYWLSTGTRASWGSVANGLATAAAPGSLSEMSCVREVEDSSAYTEADGSTRASGKFDIVIPAKLKLDFDLSVPWQPADAGFQALRAAYYSGNTIALAILDGPSTQSGVQGVWADFAVVAFPRNEPEDKEMLSKIKIKPGVSAVLPQCVAIP
jgi:hypothetical protein